MSMYDVNGIIVPEPNKSVSGPVKFEKSIKAILSIKGRMEIKTGYCIVTGDIALGRSKWIITDGDKYKLMQKALRL
ncbi:MAG: hypothetical protein JWP67_2384 [Mucilaginibacter sp.]|nr:hypothetical protein [Mucilaginibacter sp.]